jgi:hypothetical protein
MDSMGVDSGTTIIAVAYDGGVVLGADSRTSTGACPSLALPAGASAPPRAPSPPPLPLYPHLLPHLILLPQPPPYPATRAPLVRPRRLLRGQQGV